MVKNIKNKTFLVTGGTGSFGKYIVKELLKNNPKEVRIFSRDEDKQYSMLHDFTGSLPIKFIIGDVRDKDSLKKATAGVDIVLHAAALKQIPSTEYNILEAVKTNILGAQNVVDVCLEEGVEKALAISTDKAVEPVNVMGMTKAIQERIFTLANRASSNKYTMFASVRYGNVVASRGSVIPLFLRKINEGKQLEITDENMTRFILTLENATNLVFTALSEMKGGEVFVPKLKAVKILTLAELMIDEKNAKNSKIKISGVRPGEKIHETLISPSESLRTIEKNKFYVILPQIDLGPKSKNAGIGNIKEQFRYSSNNAELMTKYEIRRMLSAEKIL